MVVAVVVFGVYRVSPNLFVVLGLVLDCDNNKRKEGLHYCHAQLQCQYQLGWSLILYFSPPTHQSWKKLVYWNTKEQEKLVYWKIKEHFQNSVIFGQIHLMSFVYGH